MSLKDDWDQIIDLKDDKKIALKVFYSDSRFRYRVDVEYQNMKLSEEFNAHYCPVFGMDVSDHAEVMQITENFAVQIERKYAI